MTILKLGINKNDDAAAFKKAAELLHAGELVAFPTETVYGLGADATNPDAVEKIFIAKQRPADHPVIVHIGDSNQLSEWVREIPAAAKKLADKFWPGPLTLILNAADHVSDIITGGQKTIGIRMPGHPVARQLLAIYGGAIAAPSANRFGRLSPTRAEHVLEELNGRVNLILDGGACTLGLESTIIDLSGKIPKLLRPGPLTIDQVEEALGASVSTDKKNAPRVSGSLASHYAPQTKLIILPLKQVDSELKLLSGKYSKIALMTISQLTTDHPNIIWQQMPNDPYHYGQQLYATLRDIDHLHCDLIVVEQPSQEEHWLAINDRLQRAAG